MEALPPRFSNAGKTLHVDTELWLLLFTSQATHLCTGT